MYLEVRLLILVMVTTVVAGCSSDPCQQAVEHLQSCFPDKTINTQQALANCDAEQAEIIVHQSCESMTGGKGDGWWDWWGGGGGSSSSEGTLIVKLTKCGRNMFGEVDCSIDFGNLSCASVTVEDDNGNEVAKGVTDDGGRFTVNGLDEEANYTVRVFRTDGSPAQMIDGRSEKNAELTVQLQGETYAHFNFAPSERAHVVGCSHRIDGQIVGLCNGATLDVDETEWRWFIELESLDDGQTTVARPLVIWQESTGSQINRFTFLNLRPVQYRLSIHEMDRSFSRRNNPDYKYLLDNHIEHKNVQEETIDLSGASGDIQLNPITLQCR